MVDGLRLAAPELPLEVASKEAVSKGIDGPLRRDVLCRVMEADPP
jgi:hypothetical protein